MLNTLKRLYRKLVFVSTLSGKKDGYKSTFFNSSDALELSKVYKKKIAAK